MLANSEQRVTTNRMNNQMNDDDPALVTLNNAILSIDTSDIVITGSETRNISQREVKINCMVHVNNCYCYIYVEVCREIVASLLTTMDTRI